MGLVNASEVFLMESLDRHPARDSFTPSLDFLAQVDPSWTSGFAPDDLVKGLKPGTDEIFLHLVSLHPR